MHIKRLNIQRWLLTGVCISLYTTSALADTQGLFRLEDGHTNWQYVANSLGAIFILSLLIWVVALVKSRRQERVYSQELAAIRDELEVRVIDRTKKLDATQAYLTNVIQSMPSVLIVVNRDGTVTQWNQLAGSVTGVDADAAIGANLWDVYPNIAIVQGHIERALDGLEPIKIEHVQHGQYYYDITVYPLQGEIEAGVVIMIDDISHRVQAENMLIQRDKMASMGELAAGMAHDINSPLSAILQSVQTVQRRLSTELDINQDTAQATGLDLDKLQDYMEQREINTLLAGVHEAGHRTSAIVTNLLDFARSGSVDKKPCSVTDIIDNTIELARNVFSLQGELRFHDIKIERRFQEDLADFPCHPAEMQQVFLNLFRNASYALRMALRDDFEPCISIRVFQMDVMLTIEVEDNGIGISEDVQQHIFEPFFTNKEFSDGEGSGLGLSVSHFIVTEHHGGNIAVTSRVGKGTTFHIQMPY